MSDIAIKVEGLGKKYEIGQKKSDDFRNAFGDKIKGLLGRNGAASKQEFWALQDINFEIKKGEAVGIIGRNGAGKSTLLKYLVPDNRANKRSLSNQWSRKLPVGGRNRFSPGTNRTRKHLPEWNHTGNAPNRNESKSSMRLLPSVELKSFLDTPVKHYSSGMKVRLAFSVAAHLEPEILIVDEVLAVGDAEFQKKCLGEDG